MLEKLRKIASRSAGFGSRHRVAFLISFGICALSITLYCKVYLSAHPSPLLHFLANIELKTLDVRFQMRGKRRPGHDVVIVGIDQKSQDILGRWPFPRSDFARAVDFLREAHARVIAFDVNFPQPDTNSGLESLQSVRQDYEKLVPERLEDRVFVADLKSREAAADNDQQFAAALSRYDNAVLGYFFIPPDEAKSQNQERLKQFLDVLSFQAYPQIVHPEYARNFEGPEPEAISPDLPQFASGAKNFGFFYTDPDTDGAIRRAPTVAEFQGNFYPSLDVAATMAYRNNSLDEVKLVLNPSGVESIAVGKLTIPTDRRGFAQLDYLGPGGTFPTYSFADVVNHALPEDLFRGRLVLIGITATALGDMALTPFPSPPQFPGVEVHATMIDNILNQTFIRRAPPEYLADLLLIVLFSVGAGLLFSILSPLHATMLLIGSLMAYFLGTYALFSTYRIWIADFLPMSALFITYAGIVSYRFFFEEGEKKKVRSAFSQYMHPGLIKEILDHPEMLRPGGEEKELTALFADIRGFTTLSENLTPSQLVDILNEYLSEMTEVIFRNWGTLDKYIGDAIMAFWGAPYPQADHAMRTCQTAIEMLQALERLQESWAQRSLPRIDIGVGINTGPMLVGNIGSKRRFNYTIIGDSVNLASRLEGLNRQFGTSLIISEATFLQVKGRVVARELDLIRVKGKTQPVKVYELRGLASDAHQRTDLLNRFEQGLQAYRSGEWSEAMEVFQEIVADYPLDGPSHVFIRRCRDFLASPPEGAWDGVFSMKTK